MRRRPRWRDAPTAVTAGCALAVAAFTFFLKPAHASDRYVILGVGGRPCGSWLEVRSQALPDGPVLQSWVLGYITSVNANLLSASQDVAAGASPDTLFSWIDHYCAAHPLDSVARAASAMLDSLIVKNKAK